MLHLIASELVRMKISKESCCALRLVIKDLSPSYFENRIWDELYTVDDGGLTDGATDD